MSLEFDGTNDAVDLGAFDVSNGIDELTIAMWIKPTASDDARLLSKANGTAIANHWWALHLPALTLSIRLKTDVTTQVQGGTFPVDEWNHAAMIYNGATMRLFKNGAQVASAGKTGNVAQDGTVNVRIADNPVGDRFFEGFMEDVRIYERAITDDELNTIIALQGLDSITNNLVHRWLLNDSPDGTTASGSGSVKDSVGSVDGTPVDSPIYRGLISKTRKRVA